MRGRLLLGAAVLGLLVSACASGNEMGVRAYSSGNYDEAYAKWLPSANSDPLAAYNMGLLWKGGLATNTRANPERAAEYFLISAQLGYVPAMLEVADFQFKSGYRDSALTWLTLAARWNDQNAVMQLRQLGVQVPPPDLAAAQAANQQARQAQRDTNIAAGILVACAVSGGCGPPAATLPAQPEKQRVCVYYTPQGKRTMLPVNGVCPLNYGE